MPEARRTLTTLLLGVLPSGSLSCDKSKRTQSPQELQQPEHPGTQEARAENRLEPSNDFLREPHFSPDESFTNASLEKPAPL